MDKIEDILIRKFNIKPRFVTEEDAEFILSLRLDNRLAKFLSPTQNDIDAQRHWIRSYKERERQNKEYYFIFASNEIKYGVNRIYNINEISFEIGSWLFGRNTPEGVAILADLYARDFAFENYKLNECRFEVRKENKSVVAYHKRFNPTLIKEDDQNFYYTLTKEKYDAFKNKILKLY